MKQRVSFIRALLSPQPVICLDEPFSALDELTRLDMQKWLLSIWEEYQTTILFVTHNIDEALISFRSYCSFVYKTSKNCCRIYHSI